METISLVKCESRWEVYLEDTGEAFWIVTPVGRISIDLNDKVEDGKLNNFQRGYLNDEMREYLERTLSNLALAR